MTRFLAEVSAACNWSSRVEDEDADADAEVVVASIISPVESLG